MMTRFYTAQRKCTFFSRGDDANCVFVHESCGGANEHAPIRLARDESGMCTPISLPMANNPGETGNHENVWDADAMHCPKDKEQYHFPLQLLR